MNNLDVWQLVDTREAARRLGISPRKIWQLTDSGELASIRIGRSVRYSIADLSAFAEKLRSCSHCHKKEVQQ